MSEIEGSLKLEPAFTPGRPEGEYFTRKPTPEEWAVARRDWPGQLRTLASAIESGEFDPLQWISVRDEPGKPRMLLTRYLLILQYVDGEGA